MRRRRPRRLPPLLLLLTLPLVVHTQDDVSDNETAVVTLKGTEEVPAVTQSLMLSNGTEEEEEAGDPSYIADVLEDGGASHMEGGGDGSLAVGGDAGAAIGGSSEETTAAFQASYPDAENVTDALLGMGGAGTEPPDVNVTEAIYTEATEGGQEVTTERNEMTTEVVISKPEPEPPSPATKAPPPLTTTSVPKCGANAESVEGACKCLAGWVPDASNGSALSCLWPDLCAGKGRNFCPDGAQCYHVTYSVVSCKCEEKGKYYDPLNEKCVDVCAYYGNVVCGLVSNKACQMSNSTDVGYTCSCSKGFYLKNDTCVDADECSTSENPCGDNEDCLNSIGSFSCVCKQGYLRTSTGSCSNINECRNPRLNDCDHLCEDQTPGFTCRCHEGFVISGETKKCQLEDPSTSCDCSDPARSICYRPPGGEPQCHPKPGFKFLNGSYEDEAECAHDAEEWCGAHGECVEGEGSSYCRCRGGSFSNASNAAECVAVACPVGTVLSGLSCVDPCSLLECPYPLRCVATEGGRGECVCGILCQGLMNPEGLNSSVYDGRLLAKMPSAPESAISSKVTRTLSAYFGKGNVEVTSVQLQSKRKPRSTDTLADALVEFSVTTDLPNRSLELNDVIKKQCLRHADLPDGTCVLPGQIVVSENSIIVEVKDPCKDNPCPSTLFDCIPRKEASGRHRCSCKSGYVRINMRGTLAFCEDIDECHNTTMKRCKGDQECLNTPGSFVCREPAAKLSGESSTMKDIAVAFGILFAATLLIAIGLGYLLMKKSHRVREMVPMTETNSGFENHAFHK